MDHERDVRSPITPTGGTGVLVLRLLIAGLVGALGVALLLSGHVLIGGLILALAGVRLILFLTIRHRRAQWRQVHQGGYRRPDGQPGAVPFEPPAPYDPPV